MGQNGRNNPYQGTLPNVAYFNDPAKYWRNLLDQVQQELYQANQYVKAYETLIQDSEFILTNKFLWIRDSSENLLEILKTRGALREIQNEHPPR